MIYDPVTTFCIYIFGILAVFTLIAAVESVWTAKVERDARRRARTEVRAKRREEREISLIEWQ